MLVLVEVEVEEEKEVRVRVMVRVRWEDKIIKRATVAVARCREKDKQIEIGILGQFLKKRVSSN